LSTFAILDPDPQKINVRRVHLNVWIVPAPLHPDRYQIYFDVGIEFTVREAGDFEVELMLPMYGAKIVTEDLSSRLLDANLASLIFSDHVVVDTGSSSLTIKGEKTSKMVLVTSKATRCNDNDDAKHRLSRWKFLLQRCTVGQSLYARHRFATYLPDTMVQVNGPLRSRLGVDIRVDEGREAMSAEPMKWASANVVPIADLYVFVIWPSYLAQASNSPPFKYVRALEQNAWGEYLSNRGKGKRRPALVSYWRKTGPVTSEEPFRAHLVLQESRLRLSAIYLAIFTYGIASLALRPIDWQDVWSSIVCWVENAGAATWSKAVAGGVIGILLLIPLAWGYLTDTSKKFRAMYDWVRNLLAKLDHYQYGGVRIS
jgi:hypothetical protein